MLSNRIELKKESTTGTDVVTKAQILVRRKTNNQWESLTERIPEGEPCFSYDPATGDYILKIGAKDVNGNLQLWNQLNLLRGRVDDGELE